MPKLLQMLLGLLLLVNSSSYAQKSQYVDGRLQGVVHLKFKEGQAPASTVVSVARGAELKIGEASFDALSAQFGAYQLEPIFRATKKNAHKLQRHGLDRWFKLRIDASSDLGLALRQFEALEMVAVAEASLAVVREQGTFRKADPRQVSRKRRKQMPMNDPLLADQWHYHNDGTVSENALAGSDVNLFKAWEIETGTKDIIVSIHDEGMDVNHEDLKAAMWVNPGESEDGEDTDDNGYVDDIHGFNFAKWVGEIDPDLHGTHVGGTVAAVNNNGIGVAGVAGGNDGQGGARLMSLQILGAETTAERIAESYIYAADNGAVISQNSWGYSQPDIFEQVVIDAIDYFIVEAGDYAGSPMKGGIVIFASGNLSSQETKWYPSAYEPVVAVSAIGTDFKRARYSNFASWMDISAPGGDGPVEGPEEVLSTLPNNEYGYFAGTSMACPHVSGIAALVLSREEYRGRTADDLKRHLLLSVKNIDQYNPEEVGLLGTGYIDAAMAVEPFPSEKPQPVKKLRERGASHDFVALSWEVATAGDQEDTAPVEYAIHFKTANKEDVYQLKSEATVGTLYNIDLPGLAMNTTYEIWVEAINRWGVSSEKSEVITAHTNAGPKAVVRRNSMNADETVQRIDLDKDDLSLPYFEISNEGEGLLRWNVSMLGNNDGSGSLTDDEIKELAPSIAPFGSEAKKASAAELVIQERETPEDHDDRFTVLEDLDFPELKNEHIELYKPFPNYYMAVGDADKRVTTSMAQGYRINPDYHQPFVIKDLYTAVAYAPIFGQLTVELFIGPELATAKKVMEGKAGAVIMPDSPLEDMEVQKYTTVQFSPNSKVAIQPGEMFWVVWHVPSGGGNTFPFYLTEGYQESFSERAKMSFDWGQSWETVPELLNATGHSQYPTAVPDMWIVGGDDLDLYYNSFDFIIPQKKKGELKAGESEKVFYNYHLDSLRPMGRSNRPFDQSFFINEVEQEVLPLVQSIEYDPDGKFDISLPSLSIDLGNLVVGETSSKLFEIINNGYGNWQLKNNGVIFSDAENFGRPSAGAFTIPARHSLKHRFSFSPKSAGQHRTQVTMVESRTGQEITFELTGSAKESGRLTVEDTEGEAAIYLFDSLDVNDDLQRGSFVIKNDGGKDAASLQYVIGGYSEQEIPGHSLVNSYGYDYLTHNNDFEPSAPNARYDFNSDWNEGVMESGVDITDSLKFFRTRDVQVPIGFSFDYFGFENDSIYISDYGTLAFDPFTFHATPIFQRGQMPANGYISAIFSKLNFSRGGKVHYMHAQGKFVVQYTNVALNINAYNQMLWTFQIVLHDNGNIDILYKEVPERGPVFYNMYVAFENRGQTDGILFNAWQHAGNEGSVIPEVKDKSAVKLISPGRKLINSLSRTEGYIQPGESHQIDFEIDPKQWYENDFSQVLQIISNDTHEDSHPVANVNINMNITSGGEISLQFPHDSLRFTNVIAGERRNQVIAVVNDGTKVVTLESIENSKPEEINIIPPSDNDRKLYPGQIMSIPVSLNSEQENDEITGTITLTFEDMDSSQAVYISGNVLPAPGIDWKYEDPQLNVRAGGNPVHHPFQVENDGLSDLEISFTTSNWFNTNQLSGFDTQEQQYRYLTFSSEDEESGVNYTWRDLSIDPDAQALDVLYMMKNPYEKVSLPFDFEFYGKTYKEMLVTDLGFITFDLDSKGDWHPTFYTEIPSEDAPVHNMIAPLWSPVMANKAEYKDAGVYYKATEEMAVVQWHRFSDAFGMSHMLSFQLILYPDGGFQFQYNRLAESENDDDNQAGDDEDMYLHDLFASIGFMHEDGKQGEQVAINEAFLKHALALYFTQEEVFTIPAGAVADFNIEVNPRHLTEGIYAQDFSVHTNIPAQEVVSDLLTVSVKGEAEGHYEKELPLGHYINIQTPPANSTLWAPRQTISYFFSNVGTGPLRITDAHLEKWDQYDPIYSDPFTGTTYEFVFGVEVDDGGPWGGDFISLRPGEANFELASGEQEEFKFQLNMKWRDLDESTESIEDHLLLTYEYYDFDGQLVEVNERIPVSLTYGNPPVFGGHQEYVTETVVRGEQKKTSVQMSNAEGPSPLSYRFSLKYGREWDGFEPQAMGIEASAHTDSPQAETMNTHESKAAPKGIVRRFEDGSTDEHDDRYPEDEIANAHQVLDFIDFRESRRVLGFGKGSAFSAATKFTAPEEGFKLSKVMFKSRNEEAEIADITVSIAIGNDPATAKVVHQEQIRKIIELEEEEIEEQGTWMTVPLSDQIDIYPYEDFFVIITYPTTIAFPQFTTATHAVNPMRFYYGTMGARWYEFVYEVGFWYEAWQMIAASEEESMASWLHFDGENNEGEIPAYTKDGQINFTIDGSKLEDDFAFAELTFRTNDPKLPRPYYTDLQITVENPTNTDDELNGVELFPVPTQEVLNVHFQATASGTVTVDFVNVIGQKVHAFTEHVFEGPAALTVPVAQLATGVYFVKVSIDGELMKSQRIIKE